jgi:hypothetical protein
MISPTAVGERTDGCLDCDAAGQAMQDAVIDQVAGSPAGGGFDLGSRRLAIGSVTWQTYYSAIWVRAARGSLPMRMRTWGAAGGILGGADLASGLVS